MAEQVIVEVDRRAAAILERNPSLGPTGALSLVFAADPRLYREYRREMDAIGDALGGKASPLPLMRPGRLGRAGEKPDHDHDHD
jgi:hypothetical protein